ncbi:MAG: single-stranded DNA-binding protein [Opitutaceae bacterium]
MTRIADGAGAGESPAAEAALAASRRLREALAAMTFGPPVTHVYNPLEYAWDAQAEYLRRYLRSPIKAVFLGMNPGPWGMVQTGIPFGEVPTVRDWLGIRTSAKAPENEHPKRRIEGLACKRSEVSGRRLWGLFAERFRTPEAFFSDHFVVNYCPLAFLEETGRNHTPDKLPAAESQALTRICDRHLGELIGIIQPEWVIGVGAFAENRAREVLGNQVKIGRILHPSPASPAANRDWAGQATASLIGLGVWT